MNRLLGFFRRAMPMVLILSAWAGAAHAVTWVPDGDVAPVAARDGRVSVADALVTLRYALGLIEPDEAALGHGDIAPLDANQTPQPDGRLSVADALVTLRVALNLVTLNQDTSQYSDLDGAAQKGPFVQGSKVVAQQLEDGLGVKAGDEVVTEVDADGRYTLQLPWSGPTLVTITGYYYDESTGTQSKEQATLTSIFNSAGATGANTNLFTDLAARRLQALMLTGMGFTDAWKQAQAEVKALLGVDTPVDEGLEKLDLTDGASDRKQANGNLLMFSASVAAGLGSDSDIGKRIEAISADFAENGRIDSYGMKDWEKVIGAGTPELFDSARQKLATRFPGKQLPVADDVSGDKQPDWMDRIRVNVLDVEIERAFAQGTVLVFPVELSEAAPQALSVDYATRDRAAKSGVEYTPVSGTLQFAAGETRKEVQVAWHGSTSALASLDLELVLSDPVQVSIGRQTAIGIVRDPDRLGEMWVGKDDFQVDSFEVLEYLLNGRSRSPQRVLAFRPGSDTLQVRLELVSSVDTNCNRKTGLCFGVEDPRIDYFATVRLENDAGDDTVSLGMLRVSADEMRIRDPFGVYLQRKVATLSIESDAVGAFLVRRQQQGDGFGFRINPLVTLADSTSPQALAAAPQPIYPLSGQLAFAAIDTEMEQTPSAVSNAHCSADELAISGGARWTPSTDGNWNAAQLDYIALCTQMQPTLDGNALALSVASGSAQATAPVTGSIGGLSLHIENNLLDASGALPSAISVQLPDGVSFHEVDANGSKPKPRGRDHVTLVSQGYYSDYANLAGDAADGFLHMETLPFSIGVEDFKLQGGANGHLDAKMIRTALTQQVQFALFDKRNGAGAPSNSNRFINGQPGGGRMTLDGQGADFEMDFAAGSGEMTYPQIDMTWDSPFHVQVENSRLLPLDLKQTAGAGDQVDFRQRQACASCDDAQHRTLWSLSSDDTQWAGMGADGSMLLQMQGVPEVQWGPWVSTNDSAVFLRDQDVGRAGVVQIPGFQAPAVAAEGEAQVVNYLLGSRGIDIVGGERVPGTLHRAGSSAHRLGNQFFPGVNLGPQVYSDALRQPDPGDGSDLTGLPMSITLGGNGVDSNTEQFTSSAGTKYVVRPGGVTGVFNFDGFKVDSPVPVEVYGYPMSFRRFAFRQDVNRIDSYSWIDGQVGVPGDGDFDVTFSSLGLNCSGALEGGVVDREVCDVADPVSGNAVDENLNGLVNENCDLVLGAWKAPSEVLSMSFEPTGGGSDFCAVDKRALRLGQDVTLHALSAPLSLSALWGSDGRAADVSITGRTQYRLDDDGETARGFDISLSREIDMKANGGSANRYGWFQIQGSVALPFWDTVAVEGRIANRDAQHRDDTVLAPRGSLGTDFDDRDNAAVAILAQEPGSALQLGAHYTWGATGFDIDLPIYYEAVDLLAATPVQARFLGHTEPAFDLTVMTAKAGVKHIEPDETSVEFGASADFAALQRLDLDLHIDLANPRSLARVDGLLEDVGVDGAPLTGALSGVFDRFNLMNGLLDSGLHRALRTTLEGSLSVALDEPLQPLTGHLATLRTLPSQLSAGFQERLFDLQARYQAPLLPGLDAELPAVYAQLPGLLADFPGMAVEQQLDAVNQIKPLRDKLVAAIGALHRVAQLAGPAQRTVADLREQVDGIHAQLGGHIQEAQNGLQQVGNLLDHALDLGQCGVNLQASNLDNPPLPDLPLLQPVSDLAYAMRRASSALRSADIFTDIAIPVASAAGLDTEPYRRAQQDIRAGVQDLNRRIDSALASIEAVVDRLCAQTNVYGDPLQDAHALLGRIEGAVDDIAQFEGQLYAQLGDLLTALDDSAQQPVVQANTIAQNLQSLVDRLDLIIVGQADQAGLTLSVDKWQQELDSMLVIDEQLSFSWDGAGGQSFMLQLSADIGARFSARLDELTTMLEPPAGGGDTLMTIGFHIPALSTAQFSAQLSDSILNSAAVENLEITLNDHLSELGGELNRVNQLLLDQVNNGVRQLLAGLQEQINQLLEGASSAMASLPMASARMDGYAVIVGEELDRAHVEAAFEMSGGSEDTRRSFNAALDLTRWSSEVMGEGCQAAEDAASRLDAKISTRHLPISIGNVDTMIDQLYLVFTLKSGGQAIYPVGLGGGIRTLGDMDMGAFVLSDVAFAAAVGDLENYVGATAIGAFDEISIEAAFLVGNTCNRSVLELLDPEVSEFITFPGGVFNGMYLRSAGSLPIYDNGCALRVGVSAEMGAWVLLGPPFTVGGLVGGGAYGKAACIASIRGQVRTLLEKSGSNIKYGGSGFGVAGAGWDCDPHTWTSVRRSRRDKWCGTGDASFNAVYDNGWDIGRPGVSAIH